MTKINDEHADRRPEREYEIRTWITIAASLTLAGAIALLLLGMLWVARWLMVTWPGGLTC